MMKKIISILVLLLFTGAISLVKAQDVITKKDGSDIRAKVTEIGMNEVKYKLFNDPNGRVISLPKSEIFMILYENGTKDVFGVDSAPAQPQNPPQTQAPGQPPFQTPVATQQTGGYGNQGTVPVQRYRPQSNYRKGYVGLGFGTALLLKEYSDVEESGTHFNVNAGYLFGRHIGITASFLLTSYDASNSDDVTVGLRGGLAGPLITFGPASQIVEIDLRPTIGVVSGKVSGKSLSLKTGSTFALGFGSSVRWNVAEFVSISGNVDALFHGEFEDTDTFTMESLASVGVTFGVNFRF